MQVVVLISLGHCSRSLCVSTRLLQSFAISYAVLASGWSKHIPGAAGRGPNYCSVISAPDLPPVEAKRGLGLAPKAKKKKKVQEGAKEGWDQPQLAKLSVLPPAVDHTTQAHN